MPDEENVSSIARLLSVIDWISKILAYMTMVMTGILILVMSYEMVVRRLLNAPTLWAFDVSYMLSGVIFVAAMAFTLQRNEHVRIDFLSTRLPIRLQHAAQSDVLRHAVPARDVHPEHGGGAGGLGRVHDRTGRACQPVVAIDLAVLFRARHRPVCAGAAGDRRDYPARDQHVLTSVPRQNCTTPVPGLPALAGKDF